MKEQSVITRFGDSSSGTLAMQTPISLQLTMGAYLPFKGHDKDPHSYEYTIFNLFNDD
jgi:hypothetical protein